LNSAAEILFRHLKRVIPAESLALFVPDHEKNELRVVASSGVGSGAIDGLTIAVGDRISGWAIAHRQVVLNSNAALELGPVARTFSTPLRYAIAVPILNGPNSAAAGVISGYASEPFDNDHRRMLESAATLFAASISTNPPEKPSPRLRALRKKPKNGSTRPERQKPSLDDRPFWYRPQFGLWEGTWPLRRSGHPRRPKTVPPWFLGKLKNCIAQRKTPILLRLLEASRGAISGEFRVRLLLLEGMARFDLGDVVHSLQVLAIAVEEAKDFDVQTQFAGRFAQFLRRSDFFEPDALITDLTKLRQLAAKAGDTGSIAALHLAVARVEGLRGHCTNAHHHLELARRFVSRTQDLALACTVDVVEASLETIAGNLVRARKLAKACLTRVQLTGFAKYELAALSNLAAIALYGGDVPKARTLLDRVLPQSNEITYLRLGTLDTSALVELRDGQIDRCWSAIQECRDAIEQESLPARSWYDLAHQATRCAYYERLGDWDRVVEIADAPMRRSRGGSTRPSARRCSAPARAPWPGWDGTAMRARRWPRPCGRVRVAPSIPDRSRSVQGPLRLAAW
jgi:hypothetical protein